MIRFTKMHGIGNDYVYVNGFEERVEDPAALAPRIADRHFGVGGDGLIMVLPPGQGISADVRMRMFNADGSESEMCGNGVRCVCKLAHDRGISKANPMRIQTGRGVLTLKYTTNGDGKVDRVTVDMGEPIIHLASVPVDIEKLLWWNEAMHTAGVEVGDVCWTGTPVSMGNPHLVLYETGNVPQFKSGLGSLELERIGPALERHRAFPRRINVHWVTVHSSGEITMRTWERGSGITLACGTGASAVCVAGVLTGHTGCEILAHLPGGDLELNWDQTTNHVFMTGPATEVFRGEWNES